MSRFQKPLLLYIESANISFEEELVSRQEIIERRIAIITRTMQQRLGEKLSRVLSGMASLPATVKTMDNALAKKVFDLLDLCDVLDVDSLDDKELNDTLLEEKKSL